MRSESGQAAVIFDVGETLVNETRVYEEWADYLGVPRFTFMAAFGASIERGQHHQDVFRLFEPNISVEELFAKREREGHPQVLTEDDLYPDAVSALETVRAAGYFVGITGNQPESVHRFLTDTFPNIDLLATSDEWGVEKPSPEFFARIISEVGLPPDRIAYVGDRVDNDVVPAADAGMVAVFIRRGPWGVIQSERPDVSRATVRIDSLAELPGPLAKLLPPD